MAINYNSQLPYDNPESYNSHRRFVGQGCSKAKQFPEFFREDYQSFVQFIDLYYQFLDTTYSGNLDGQLDIDRTDEIFLENYRLQYAVTMPKFDHIQVRQFIQNAKAFYSSKGTENSIKFLFKIAFNDEIQISYPGESTLKAQSGKWSQDYYLAASDTGRQIEPQTPFDLVFRLDDRIFRHAIDKIENIPDTNNIRIFIKPQQNLSFVSDIKLYAGTIQDSTCIGTLIKQPQNLRIVEGGQYWSVGQLIQIPGQLKDTVARVTKVSSTGSIERVEPVEFGYPHEFGQIHHAHPFSKRPQNTYETAVSKTLISINPIRYIYAVKIFDTHSVTDTELIVFSDADRQSAYYTDYSMPAAWANNSYSSEEIIRLYSQPPGNLEYTAGEISIANWNRQQAIFYIDFDYIVKTAGQYITDSGQLQNRRIVLQDNLYYQQFQYLIETTIDQKRFRPYTELVHPIGTKQFQNLKLEFNTDVVSNYVADAHKAYSRGFTDIMVRTDATSKHIVKQLSDEITLPDESIKSVQKTVADTLTVQHTVDNSVNSTNTGYFSESYVDLTDPQNLYAYLNNSTLVI